MQEEPENTTTTDEDAEAKPTITIAEKQSGAAAGEAKPTITIAERDGDDD